MPKSSFAGGCLIGCSGGFLNVPKIKGTHMAMKTGILAAEAAYAEIRATPDAKEPLHMNGYQRQLDMSWVMFELEAVRICTAHTAFAYLTCVSGQRIVCVFARGPIHSIYKQSMHEQSKLSCMPAGEKHPSGFQVGSLARPCECCNGDICLPMAIGWATMDHSSQCSR